MGSISLSEDETIELIYSLMQVPGTSHKWVWDGVGVRAYFCVCVCLVCVCVQAKGKAPFLFFAGLNFDTYRCCVYFGFYREAISRVRQCSTSLFNSETPMRINMFSVLVHFNWSWPQKLNLLFTGPLVCCMS